MINKDQDKFKLKPTDAEAETVDVEDLKKMAAEQSQHLIAGASKDSQQNPDEKASSKVDEATKEQEKKNMRSPEKLSKDSFEVICKLGEGSYAKVYLVRKKNTLKQYALKQLDKIQIIKHDKIESVHRERDILMSAKHPNIVTLDCTFSDESNLYFLLEYAANRSLGELLKQIKPLPLELTKYYAAEIISALEFIHNKGIVHRDLKPENILLDSKFHIKITDFGDSKVFTNEEPKPLHRQHTGGGTKSSMVDFDDSPSNDRGTFVGTPLYVAPEMLDSNTSGPFTDLWALGCIIFQCLTGDVPFRANYDYQVFQMIQERRLVFPKYLPLEAIDVIDKLMQLNPLLRLGAGMTGTENDYEHLKAHPFFKGINFQKLLKTPPPIPAERFQAALQTIKQREKEKQEKDETKENDVIDLLVNELKDYGEDQKMPEKKTVNKKDQEKESQKQIDHEGDQMVVKSGIVFKKKGVISNLKRKLILTNQPRLYYTTDTGEYKADILLTPMVSAVYKALDRFDITCKKSGKTIIFKITGEDANIWVSKINRVIESQTK